jgi:hypothetical protein
MARLYPSPLRSLLIEAGVSEPTYNTFVRQSSVMRPRRKGKGPPSLDELLALRLFAVFRSRGLAIREAVEVVDFAFPTIRAFSADHQSMHVFKVGAVFLLINGRMRVQPASSTLPSGARELGRLEFDLAEVARFPRPIPSSA